MSRSANLIIWLIGLMGCAIPIVIIFVSNMVPDAGIQTGVTVMDVARQAYANILFVIIAVSGIAIAEAIILFFRMVEVGEQRATPALWLLTMVLLIVFSSISYARVVGTSFQPSSVSDQQLMLALAGAALSIVAALALRLSIIRLEKIARQHIHDNAVMTTLEEMRDTQEEQIDMYEFAPFASEESPKEDQRERAEITPEPVKRVIAAPAPVLPLEPKEPAAADVPTTPSSEIPDQIRAERKSQAEERAAALAEELSAYTPEADDQEEVPVAEEVAETQKDVSECAPEKPKPTENPKSSAEGKAAMPGSRIKRARSKARTKSR